MTSQTEKPKWFYLERYNDAFKEELRSFIKCIATGQEPVVNGNDGLQAELLAHAAAKSLKEGRPVQTKEILLEIGQLHLEYGK